MELNKCLGCMEDFRDYPCPNCGFDPGQGQKNTFSLPPQTILYGKYLVGRVLGQGGFGITYIGWDIALARKVAIKEYYPSGQVSRVPGSRSLIWSESDSAVAARQDGLEMFLKEARKMARVDDIPGVVRVRDLFRENDTAYIVMDFVEGETLKARLTRTGPMSWDQAKEIFQPAIRAMEQVHKAGLIHRDLSPDNLMLTKDGQVFILDLGAAKDLNVNQGASSMQVAKGGFSPYEQYSQRGGSGPWTDVYAMAATIYFTLTGKIPPIAIDRAEDDTISWDLPRLDTLPRQALEALKKAMVVSARDRIQSMAKLEWELFKIGPSPKPDLMRKKLVWVAAAAVVVLGGVLWGTVLKPGTSVEPKAMPPERGVETHETIMAATEASPEIATLAPPETPDDDWVSAPESEPESVPGAEPKESPKPVKAMQQVSSIAAGSYHTVGLRSSGTVVAVGRNDLGRCDVSGWTDIVAVAAGYAHTVGLRSDGTVVAAGNGNGCDVKGWTDIVAVAAGDFHTVGLRSNGTVVAVGSNKNGQCDISGWSDIVAVAAGCTHTVGLHRDGTVVAVGDNEDGQCDVSGWSDIVAVAAGNYHTVGLRSDGTVVAVGKNKSGQCNVSGWSDIVALSAGWNYTVGLRRDGTVVAVGYNGDGQCDVNGWSDIVAVSAGWDHTVGLRSNGTVVAVGKNEYGQCNVSAWSDIRTPQESTQQ